MQLTYINYLYHSTVEFYYKLYLYYLYTIYTYLKLTMQDLSVLAMNKSMTFFKTAFEVGWYTTFHAHVI
jgi:hypothetical protein